MTFTLNNKKKMAVPSTKATKDTPAVKQVGLLLAVVRGDAHHGEQGASQ